MLLIAYIKGTDIKSASFVGAPNLNLNNQRSGGLILYVAFICRISYKKINFWVTSHNNIMLDIDIFM